MAPTGLPFFWRRLLHWFCEPSLLEELEGDLEERFYLDELQYSTSVAVRNYRREVLFLFRPSVWKKKIISRQSIYTPMFYYNLKISIRHLLKDRLNAFIKLSSLSIGLASVFLILLFVRQEYSVDKNFTNSDRIFRINNDERPYNANGRFLTTTGPPFAPTLAEQYPEVEHAVRIRMADDVRLQYGNQQLYEKNLIYVDPDFLKLFDFPLQEGSVDQALEQPNSIVLTRRSAEKIFGAEDPLGKTIRMDDEVMLQVTGVLAEDLPRSHLKFDYLVSFSTFKVPFGYPVSLDSWGWISFHSYVMLRDGITKERVDKKLIAFAKEFMYKDREVRSQYQLQPLEEIYFNSNGMMNAGEHHRGNQTYTNILLFIALLILIIAGFNFTNIGIAKSVQRAREIGVRKVLGSSKYRLFKQFMGESVFTALFAYGLALCMVWLLGPRLFGQLGWEPFAYDQQYLITAFYLFSLTILFGMAAATYPAMVAARFAPVSALKNWINPNRLKSRFREGLVLMQFVVTCGLITCALVISRQLKFIDGKGLGFDKEQIVTLKMLTPDFKQKYQLAKEVFAQNPNVISVTAGDNIDGDYGSVPMTPEGSEEGIAMNMMGGYFNYCTTMGFELIEGRDFSQQHPIDTLQAVIINEAAQRTFGWENPLGQKLQVNSNINGEVIGVVRDFHFYSLHNPIEPMVIVMPRTHMDQISLRIASNVAMEDAVASLQSDWQQICPDLPFSLTFLDDLINQQYLDETKFSRLISFFGFLAILISAMGLYGLIIVMTNYRRKEVGIRKVLGASTKSIYIILIRNFILIVVFANLLAIPLSRWIMVNWLEQFSYRTNLSYEIFIQAVVLSTLVALVALSFEVLKAARMNPISTIRHD